MRSNFLCCILNFSITLIIKANGVISESPSSLDTNQQRLANKDNPEVACICPAIYNPVCGSDGKTYSNPCVLSCTRTTNPFVFGLCKGECPCCNEPFYNDPLDNQEIGFWGWDRMTGSPHVALIAKLEDGLSEQSRFDEKFNSKYCNKTIPVPDCPCPKNYKPVCGSDGNTYGNACVLECQQRVRPCLLQACTGVCPCCPGACNVTEAPSTQPTTT